MLKLAAEHGQLDTLKWLVENGSDLAVLDSVRIRRVGISCNVSALFYFES